MMSKVLSVLAVLMLAVVPVFAFAADLTVSKVEPVCSSMRCDFIVTVTGDLAKARDLVLDVTWYPDVGTGRTVGHGKQMGIDHRYTGTSGQLKNPILDLSKGTVKFSKKFDRAGSRSAEFSLGYSTDGKRKKTSPIRVGSIVTKE